MDSEKKHSTCSAVFDLVQFLYNSHVRREHVSCVYIDYSKVFDTIDHSIFCNKTVVLRLT